MHLRQNPVIFGYPVLFTKRIFLLLFVNKLGNNIGDRNKGSSLVAATWSLAV